MVPDRQVIPKCFVKCLFGNQFLVPSPSYDTGTAWVGGFKVSTSTVNTKPIQTACPFQHSHTHTHVLLLQPPHTKGPISRTPSLIWLAPQVGSSCRRVGLVRLWALHRPAGAPADTIAQDGQVWSAQHSAFLPWPGASRATHTAPFVCLSLRLRWGLSKIPPPCSHDSQKSLMCVTRVFFFFNLEQGTVDMPLFHSHSTW